MTTPLPDAAPPPPSEEALFEAATRLNVYRTMAHHPSLLRAWGPLREHIVAGSSLGKLRSEIVILRTGHRWGSEYEWAHHVVRGRAAGLSNDRITALRGPLGDIEPDDRILAAAVDGLLDHGFLDERCLAQVSGLIGERGVLDLMATVGMYTTLAFVVKSFATPIDSDIMAVLAEP